ncbi:MAG: hypothetical protein JXR73_11925 [Candidatus Omnitrophica bacterium]|nr:hypothetical protein [Candidatus Omnitrophota bacterium]
MLRNVLHVLLLLFAAALFSAADTPSNLQLEAYITAHQVDQYFSTPESRLKALRVYQDIGISKVYLETHRSGHQPGEALLREARDFLRANGIEVSGGITTTAGENFGEPSDRNRYWLNYQHPKTQTDLAAHFRKAARLFDEIMVDDFLATDDESDLSAAAKGERSWSEYRLQLMADFARRFIIEPAREVNPDIQFIEKFPQWYDRFHIFGYNVLEAPRLFDRIWVGTETRNPNTLRFGYTMPTEGYVNYRWLASTAGEKIAGAWFDFGDCAPGPYLMQAYQSVLAGAQELVLFETGSLIDHNECIEPFMQRRGALRALAELLKDRPRLGMHAYKPPNSNGSDADGAANLYIFDYIATLGLVPLPVANIPDDAKCLFLARQAADDPEIAVQLKAGLKQGVKIVATPDFLQTLNDSSLSNISERNALPIFSKQKTDAGDLLVLNLQTFRHEEFAPDKEMFLPPRPLPVRDWPAEEVNRIRKEILSTWGVEISGPNNVGIYLFDDLIVLANFNDEEAPCEVKSSQGGKASFRLNPSFPHAAPTICSSGAGACRITVAAWETAVIDWIREQPD